jgi:hypothetical protein
MPTKVDTGTHESTTLTPKVGGTSGTLVIIGVVVLAILAAAASWWARYNATHQAARFWGPKAAKLIRDAPKVTFYYFVRDVGAIDDPAVLHKLTDRSLERARRGVGEVDVSQARGFTHLRNALLEDKSFRWGPPPKNMPRAGWVLWFQEPATDEEVFLVFAQNANYCALPGEATGPRVISCEPISPGLWEIFAKLTMVPPLLPSEHR